MCVWLNAWERVHLQAWDGRATTQAHVLPLGLLAGHNIGVVPRVLLGVTANVPVVGEIERVCV
jgi:hypothetical protein